MRCVAAAAAAVAPQSSRGAAAMADLAALRALLDESDDEGPPRPPRPVTPVQAPPPQPAPPPPPQLGPPQTAPPRDVAPKSRAKRKPQASFDGESSSDDDRPRPPRPPPKRKAPPAKKARAPPPPQRAPPRTTAAPRDDYTVVTTESGRKPQRQTRKRPAQPGGGPQKTCPACDAKVSLRKARCDCGHVFVSKKQRAPPPASEAGSDSDGVFDEAAATRDAKRLKVAELRAALEAAGADTEGLKAELVERLVAARRAAFYAPPPPPSDSDSDSDAGVDIAAEEATKEKLLALLAECDDDEAAAPAPKTKKQKKQARPPAGGVPKPRGRAPAGATWDYAAGARTAARPGGAAADTGALRATLESALDGMVRTGDLSREQADAVLREYGRLAPAGAPLDRRRVKDRLVGKIEQMFAEAPRTSKKERYALARLEREAQYVEEGPRLADYGIDGASGLELGNPLGLED